MGKIFKVIGLMSGTSLDGVDVAYCHFEQVNKSWQFKIIDTETVEYPNNIKNRIKDTLSMSGQDLVKLDMDLGRLYGELVADFVDRYDITVDFVSSHGHTIYHQPEIGMTYQAGNGQAIAIGCNLPVVHDFRTSDLLLGGQGAPLVPIGDEFLFPEYQACINLGGIANISFLNKGRRLAYDICPANMPLNIIAGKAGKEYDHNGEMARSGKVDEKLLDRLNRLEYYSEPGPKSLGYEWVNEYIMGAVQGSGASIPDQLATLVEHCTSQLAMVLKNESIEGRVLVTGGGALNVFLMERLQQLKPEQTVLEIPARELVVYKEALIFAFMGVLKWQGMPNILSSVTGAGKDHSAGSIIRP